MGALAPIEPKKTYTIFTRWLSLERLLLLLPDDMWGRRADDDDTGQRLDKPLSPALLGIHGLFETVDEGARI